MFLYFILLTSIFHTVLLEKRIYKLGKESVPTQLCLNHTVCPAYPIGQCCQYACCNLQEGETCCNGECCASFQICSFETGKCKMN